MKQRLNDNANLLGSKDLYGMVGIVEENCKAAVDQSNPAEVREPSGAPTRRAIARADADGCASRQVEIDIDSLDLPTFIKVDKYVKDCIQRNKKKA